MKIKCIELTKNDFAPYGMIMSGADVTGFEPLGPDDDYTYTSTTVGVQMDADCCSGMLICKNREMVVSKMEHHARTSEILVAVKNDFVLCVAPANEQKVEISKIKAFKVKQGSVLVMSRACWHGYHSLLITEMLKYW